MNDTPFADNHRKLGRLNDSLGRVIEGKSEGIEILTIALIAGGSVLMEDVPGVGKTTLAKALAKSIDAEFNRIQFTPDLLPGDILGSSIYNPVDGTFTFRPGPIFCNILLGDEINRASPRTQSALLEAMSEHQVTIEGTRRTLEAPFLVIATENPIEFHGTYPLPEAQLDRFLMLLALGYPDPDTEVHILHTQREQHPINSVEPVVSKDDVLEMQRLVRTTRVDESVSNYVVEIVGQTRRDHRLKLGASPRGSLMLFRAAQAAAFSSGRDFAMPDDVKRMAPHVLSHRVVLTSESKYGGMAKADVIAEILDEVKVPT